MSRFNLQSSSLACQPIFFIITTRQPSLLLSFTATKPIFSTNSFYLKTFGIPGLPNSRSVAHRFIFMVVRFSFKFLCLSRVVDWLHVSCNCLLCVKYTASYLVVSYFMPFYVVCRLLSAVLIYRKTSCAARWPPQYAPAPADRRPTYLPMCVPNLKIVAFSVCEILSGSQNFKIGSRTPGDAHLGANLWSMGKNCPRPMCVPNLKGVALSV